MEYYAVVEKNKDGFLCIGVEDHQDSFKKCGNMLSWQKEKYIHNYVDSVEYPWKGI